MYSGVQGLAGPGPGLCVVRYVRCNELLVNMKMGALGAVLQDTNWWDPIPCILPLRASAKGTLYVRVATQLYRGGIHARGQLNRDAAVQLGQALLVHLPSATQSRATAQTTVCAMCSQNIAAPAPLTARHSDGFSAHPALLWVTRPG